MEKKKKLSKEVFRRSPSEDGSDSLKSVVLKSLNEEKKKVGLI